MSLTANALISGLAAIMTIMFVAWLLSIPRRDVSIVDIFWGLNLLAAAVAYALVLSPAPRAAAVLVLVGLWALRLSAYIAVRNHHRPEDRRYRAMRARRGDAFWWRSLYVVFLSQAVLAWVLSWTLFGAMHSAAPLGALDMAGVALSLFGLGFETIADVQLSRFLARPAAGGAVMDQGLWRYTRHPNYFGECCFWWGLFLLSAGAGNWWTVVAPLMMTLLLLKVSGVSLTERDIGQRRPAYREYARRTSAFLPWWPKPAD